MLSPINSRHGISVVGQKTRFNYENLNVCMPQVLQQHYGQDNRVNEYTSIRNTYGYNITRKTVISDPSRIFTKPFGTSMATMANMFHKVLCSNKDELNLNNVDLSTVFNHCSILVYYSIPSVKEVSSMGWHADITHDADGKYQASQNSQRINTPTVVYTLGDERTLNWRRRLWSNKKVLMDKLFKHAMNLPEGSAVLINPLDETPKPMTNSDSNEQFVHGNVKVRKGKMSICLAFRVVDYVNLYDNNNNLIHPTHVPFLDFAALYKDFDCNDYQTLLREAFFTVFGTDV